MYTVEFWFDFPSVFFALPSIRRGKQLLGTPCTFCLISFFPKASSSLEVGYNQIVYFVFYVCLSQWVKMGVPNSGPVIVNTRKSKEGKTQSSVIIALSFPPFLLKVLLPKKLSGAQ